MSKSFPVKSWSYSSWSLGHRCEYAWYRTYILGFREPAGPAAQRGIELHMKAEHYLKGSVTSLPKEFKEFKPHYAALKKQNPVVEQFWGVSKEWKPTGKGSWVVMKMDAAVLPSKKNDYTLVIQDLKSGREWPGHADQGSLYACIGYALYPQAKQVEAEFWYIDQGYPSTHVFTLKDIRKHTKRWIQRGEDLLTPRKKYLPSPTDDNCRYCFHRSDKNGDCNAWKTLRKG